MIPSNGYQAAGWLKAVMKSTSKITEAIPDDLSPQEIVARVRDTSELAVKVEVSRDKTHAVLGRLLMLARQKPQSYESLGYTTFGAYLSDEVQGKYGVGRSTMYAVKRISEKWGSLPVETYGAVGQQKLLHLAKFSSQDDSSAPKLLKAASEKTLEDLKDWTDSKGYLPKSEATGASITITGNVAQIRELKRFLARKDIKSYAGSEPIEILLAAIIEVDESWTAAAKEVG